MKLDVRLKKNKILHYFKRRHCENFVANEHHSYTFVFTFSVVVVDLPTDRLHLKFPFSRQNWRSRSSLFPVNRRRRRELRRGS